MLFVDKFKQECDLLVCESALNGLVQQIRVVILRLLIWVGTSHGECLKVEIELIFLLISFSQLNQDLEPLSWCALSNPELHIAFKVRFVAFDGFEHLDQQVDVLPSRLNKRPAVDKQLVSDAFLDQSNYYLHVVGPNASGDQELEALCEIFRRDLCFE